MRQAILRDGNTETEAETQIFRDEDWHKESDTKGKSHVQREDIAAKLSARERHNGSRR